MEKKQYQSATKPKKIKIKRNKLHHKHTQSSNSKVNQFKSHTHREF